MTHPLRLTAVVCTGIAALFLANAALGDGWGNVAGQFLYDGAAPEPGPLFEEGKVIKDVEVCRADGVEQKKNDLLVDAKTKGIRNIFVYMARSPKSIHPGFEKPQQAVVKFDQKNCRFSPHAMVLRTDQKVLVLSNDNCAHNTHTYPVVNDAVNFLMAANDREGIPLSFKKSERLPISVKCDIHPWMVSKWLILDHPYAVLTGPDGKFSIRNLPAGEHKFKVWHERAYYIHRRSNHPVFPEIDGKKTFKVTVIDGKTTQLGPIALNPELFEED